TNQSPRHAATSKSTRPMSLPTVPSLRRSALPSARQNTPQPRWRQRECSSVTSTRPASGSSASGLEGPPLPGLAALRRWAPPVLAPLAREAADTGFDFLEVDVNEASTCHYDFTIYHDIGDGARRKRKIGRA